MDHNLFSLTLNPACFSQGQPKISAKGIPHIQVKDQSKVLDGGDGQGGRKGRGGARARAWPLGLQICLALVCLLPRGVITVAPGPVFTFAELQRQTNDISTKPLRA